MAQRMMDNGSQVRMAAVEQLSRGNGRTMLDPVVEECQCMGVDEQQQGAGNDEQQLETG